MKRAEIAREVIAGYWGSGSKRIEALKKAGYDPEVVQGDVNTLLCCRENIIQNMRAMAVSIAGNNNWWYIYWTEKYGHECAICHPHGGENHGWQCIGFTIACWHHSGLPIPCNCGVIDNGTSEKILKAKTDAEALKIAQSHLGIKDIQVIRNKNGIPKGQARPGDMALLFSGTVFHHMFLIMSGSKIADSTKAAKKSDDIRADRNFGGRYVSNLKVLIRYTGKGLCPPPKRTVTELAFEVIDGLWGSGESRKIALTEAGHDYDAVQKRVNEILNQEYPGQLPTMALKKTNAEVIKDACAWARWIAGDNSFHYGHGQAAHKYGCYFCGTEPKSKKDAGIKDYERTYCCNPFVFSAYAHGGCDPDMMSKCLNKKNSQTGIFTDGKHFKKLGKPAFSTLKKGDVLYWNKSDSCHYALYLGNGKLAEAVSGDDNVKGSKKWNNSIHIRDITSWGSFQGASRYIGSVDTDMYIRHGEVSDRVGLLQDFLRWMGYDIKTDRIFGDATCKAVKDTQTKLGLTADGIVGPATLKAIEEIV